MLDRNAVADLIRDHATGAIPGHAEARQMLLYELWQLDMIWKRFLDGRGRQQADDQALDSDGDRDLEVATRVDAKSLFLFGDVLLSVCALATKLVGGEVAGVDYNSYSRFLNSVRRRELNDLPTRILRRAGPAAENIEGLLGFYRDKFIVHVEYAYSQGVMRDVYSPRYQLRHWRRDADLGALVDTERILGLPVRDRQGFTHVEQFRDAESRVEAVVKNLHTLTDKDEHESAVRAIRSIGFLTPDLHDVMRDLLAVVTAFLIELHDEGVHQYNAKAKGER